MVGIAEAVEAAETGSGSGSGSGQPPGVFLTTKSIPLACSSYVAGVVSVATNLS